VSIFHILLPARQHDRPPPVAFPGVRRCFTAVDPEANGFCSKRVPRGRGYGNGSRGRWVSRARIEEVRAQMENTSRQPSAIEELKPGPFERKFVTAGRNCDAHRPKRRATACHLDSSPGPRNP
jgi:hypothetical protein